MRVYKTSYKKEGRRRKCKIWRIKGKDHLGIMRFFSSGSKDKKVADDIANKIQIIMDCVRSQKSLSPTLLQFLRGSPKIANKLTKPKEQGGYEILDEKKHHCIKIPTAAHRGFLL